ncbi:hypothetical protein CPC08DRAFT_608257, partial [Agrocybe pediades]
KPTMYDGRSDARAYHRFVKESAAYLEDSGIKRKRRAFSLSYFMEGRAYDFYVQKVSRTEDDWDMPTFYEALFNYCFPIDYRQKMHRKFDNATQGHRAVSEYAHYLEELSNLIGTITTRDLVNRFWNGTNEPIQKALWRDGLHPDSSTWEEV